MNNVLIEVDISEYFRNIKFLRSRIPESTMFMAVVKANAYGLGAVKMAQSAVLAGADYLGVAHPEEGFELRNNEIKAPILLFSEPDQRYCHEIVHSQITQTIYTKEFAEALNIYAGLQKITAKVHIKVDSGMGRLGVKPHNLLDFIQFIMTLTNLEMEGIFTHFANAGNISSSFTMEQLIRFQSTLTLLENAGIHIPIKHAANSQAILNFPCSHLDMVRSGQATYANVFSIKSRIAHIKYLQANDPVGYNCAYVCSQPTYIATVSAGYADGIPRKLNGKGRVLIRGRYYPIVGDVCMDILMVNLGSQPPDADIGDEVVIIGKQGNNQITVDEICQASNKIFYEIPCGFGKRVPRIYIN
ncbi:alanine racemase [Thermoproteota archaeon]